MTAAAASASALSAATCAAFASATALLAASRAAALCAAAPARAQSNNPECIANLCGSPQQNGGGGCGCGGGSILFNYTDDGKTVYMLVHEEYHGEDVCSKDDQSTNCLFSAVTFVLCLSPTTRPLKADVPAGFESLFNGRNLTGWQINKGGDIKA